LSAPLVKNNQKQFRGFGKIRQIKFPELIMGEDETREILNRPGTAHVVSTIYRFNNFFQNPLLRDSFLDLYIPANKLIDRVKSKDNTANWGFSDKKLNELLNEFQWAIRERAMGAYLFTEDDEHSFSPIRGGLQKIILALASIPFSLLNELLKQKISWQGYVSIGLKDEPMHFYENLHIHFEDALYPEKFWWCCIHEIGHILAGSWKILDRTNPIVQYAIGKLPNQSESYVEAFINMADNCFADTFDFIVGFLCNRALYFEACWPFILNIIKRQDKPQDYFMRHINRHFFGWIFERRFLSTRKRIGKITNFDSLVYEGKAFLKKLEHVPEVKTYLAEHIVNRKKFIEDFATQTYSYLHLLDHFKNCLDPAIDLVKELKNEYGSSRFKKVIRKITTEGKIVSYKLIKFPHLIPLKLRELSLKGQADDKIAFRVRITTIVSLYWYSYNYIIKDILTIKIKT
jgi:hypothetical protein